ncbi:MAG: inosine/xanthosine triphosphatase [Ignisphaera sp.]|uniref:inosine/xanthosine triphosphatase n=1 Tax=Ignisphaera aggregans TaxID=334771 RepID=A0A7J3MWP7_9CREN
MVRVCIGSKNPAKLKGVERAFRQFFDVVKVEGYGVEGVPKQPIGLENILRFARYRAEKIKEIDALCDFYLGIEAGLMNIEEIGYFDVHITYLIDKNNRTSYGFSPAFAIPKKFVEFLVSGVYEELEEIVDTHYGTSNIGDKGGFISLLTKNNVVREDLVYYSVIMALIPIINSDTYLE